MQSQGSAPAGLAEDLRQCGCVLHAAAHIDRLLQRPAALPYALDSRRVRGPAARGLTAAARPDLVFSTANLPLAPAAASAACA